LKNGSFYLTSFILHDMNDIAVTNLNVIVTINQLVRNINPLDLNIICIVQITNYNFLRKKTIINV